MNQNSVIDLNEYRKKKEEENKPDPIKAFHVDHFYSYPEFGISAHVLAITDKSLYYQNTPIYILQDQSGQIYTLPLDENACVGWVEITGKEFLSSMFQPDEPDPSNVS